MRKLCWEHKSLDEQLPVASHDTSARYTIECAYHMPPELSFSVMTHQHVIP